MNRPALKRGLLAVASFARLLALAVAVYGVHLARELDTPGFRKSLLEQASTAAGADVRVKEMDISLLSGVTLKGLTVANPAPISGNLLAAEAFVLRYRLLPLLAGRAEVERLAFEKPALSLAVDARGVFNYERLGGSTRSARKATPAATAGASLVPLRIVLRHLSVRNASIVMADPEGSMPTTGRGGLRARSDRGGSRRAPARPRSPRSTSGTCCSCGE
jgi:uncharacterized protein involved in outer membrane biogenesis